MTGHYKMSTVCERTGFNQSLLRAWERRHGLLEPTRTEGGHRLYTDDDLRVLEVISQLMKVGHVIGEIASRGREALLEAHARSAAEEVSEATIPSPQFGVEAQAAAGNEGLAALVQRLALAAARVDELEVEAGLDAAFAALSPQGAFERVLMPALFEIGRLWESGRCSTAGEHLFSCKVVGRLHSLLRIANSTSPSARHALCACLPDEDHEIGALYAAFTLARHGCRITYLGARLPFDALERTAEGLRPNLICLSISSNNTLERRRAELIELARRLPTGVRLILGGGGIRAADAQLEAAGIQLVFPGGPLLVELLA